MNIFESKYVQVNYNPVTNSVETIWKDFATSDEFRKTIDIVYEAMIKNKPQNWVVDFTRAGVVAVKDQEWFYNKVLPKMARAGIKKAPVVASGDVFSKMHSDEAKRHMNRMGIESRYFENRQAIEEWLLTGNLNQEHPRAGKFNTFNLF
ncbi:MAG: hypothetical protein NW226_04500 [Microscillaceae bacterium]|nr:hypothetical protein [Microscillaceae bacterium]